MRRMKEPIVASALVVINVLAISTAFTVPVYGYIDPSAVTYVIQAVAGVVIALGALITVFRHKIIAFFKKDKKEEARKEIHFNDETKDTIEKNND